MQPLGEPEQYQSFIVRQPVATHTRPATCEEYGCPMMARGWRTTLNERDPEQEANARWIRKASGRDFTEERKEDGTTVFTFTPGQPCFANGQHRVSNDRPAGLLIARGDYRQIMGPRAAGMDEWTDRLGESVSELAEIRQRG